MKEYPHEISIGRSGKGKGSLVMKTRQYNIAKLQCYRKIMKKTHIAGKMEEAEEKDKRKE